MDGELNPITVAALLGRMITLQFPEFNFPGDVIVSELERTLAKQLFEIMLNMVADEKDNEIYHNIQNMCQVQIHEQSESNITIKEEPKDNAARAENPNAMEFRPVENSNSSRDSEKSGCSGTSNMDINKRRQLKSNARKTPECSSEQDSGSFVMDRTIKREVEEFHVSNINLQGQSNSSNKATSDKTSPKRTDARPVEDPFPEDVSRDNQISTSNLTVQVPVVEASKTYVSLPVQQKLPPCSIVQNTVNRVVQSTGIEESNRSSETHEKNKNFPLLGEKPIIMKSNDLSETIIVTNAINKLCSGSVQKKSSVKTCISSPKDIDEIICLDDSDEDEGEAQEHSKEYNSRKRSQYSKSDPIPCKTSRSEFQRRPTEEEIKAEAKVRSIQNALKMEMYTLEEFTRVRKENRKVLGTDIRKWATIRACTYTDFEYTVGNDWVKYFINKYKIKYDKFIGSLVFEGGHPPAFDKKKV